MAERGDTPRSRHTDLGWSGLRPLEEPVLDPRLTPVPGTERADAAAERELGRLLGAAREIRDAVAAGLISKDALDLLRELAPQAPPARAGSGYFASAPVDPLGGTFEVPEHDYGPSATAGGRGIGPYGWQDFGEGSGQGSRDPFGVSRLGLVADDFQQGLIGGHPGDSIPFPGPRHPSNARDAYLSKRLDDFHPPEPWENDNPEYLFRLDQERRAHAAETERRHAAERHEDRHRQVDLDVDGEKRRKDAGPDSAPPGAAEFLQALGLAGAKYWRPAPAAGPRGPGGRPDPTESSSTPFRGRYLAPLPLADEPDRPQRATSLSRTLPRTPGGYDPRRPT